MLLGMSESLIDDAVRCSRTLLQEVDDVDARRGLSLRLELLERAAWSLSLEPAARDEVVRLVRLLLEVRDEVVTAARRSMRRRPDLLDAG
ncbi:MAG: hypothetical protein JWO86_4116 [Myxococcaceae bacterium]|jgi:hypothetical protein|nr:hypothetical protein [Myxococcaceae bacterium]MEA2747519.1 hypothetical protein [Myxococcales bacterium]